MKDKEFISLSVKRRETIQLSEIIYEYLCIDFESEIKDDIKKFLDNSKWEELKELYNLGKTEGWDIVLKKIKEILTEGESLYES